MISVSGLAIGIACCLLIYLYVQDKWSFDRFHKNAHSIYRMIRMSKNDSALPDGSEDTSALLGPELRRTFPEVERTSRISPAELVVTFGDQAFKAAWMNPVESLRYE
ncbi:MAG: ABC transporter permease [bacterium]